MPETFLIFGGVSLSALLLGWLARIKGREGASTLLAAVVSLFMMIGWILRFGWPVTFGASAVQSAPWLMLAALATGAVLDRCPARDWVEHLLIALLALGAGVLSWFSFPSETLLWSRILSAGLLGTGAALLLQRLKRMRSDPALATLCLTAATAGLYGSALLTGSLSTIVPVLFMGAALFGVFPWLSRCSPLSPAFFLGVGCAWITLADDLMKKASLWPLLPLILIFFAENAFSTEKNPQIKGKKLSSYRRFGLLSVACILCVFVALLMAYVASSGLKGPF